MRHPRRKIAYIRVTEILVVVPSRATTPVPVNLPDAGQMPMLDTRVFVFLPLTGAMLVSPPPASRVVSVVMLSVALP